MQSGVSGMGAEGDALNIIGDNVANSNTVGFKQSRALFEDQLAGAMGVGAPGGGVRMLRAQQIFAQGNIQNTGVPTDLAISGDGFFEVAGNVNGVNDTYFTRAGQATLANDGSLVNPNGLNFLGYTANPDGTFASQPTPIKISSAQLPPKPTANVNITANLDSADVTPTAAWDPNNPAATSNYSTSVQVYDSLGQSHTVDVYFRNNGAGSWDWHAIVAGADLAGGTPGTNQEVGTGTLGFSPTGALSTSTVSLPLTPSFVNAAAGQPITLNFGTPASTSGTGMGGTQMTATKDSISAQNQDGYASGSLTGVSVDAQGTVNGVYTNGQTVAVARLALAKFTSNDGLAREGQNLWAQTVQSGPPAVGAASTGGRGSIQSGALEQSNVDVAQAFTDLIVHQRAFQANSKTIQTADEMMQQVLDLKR